jgi:hypothetical protein
MLAGLLETTLQLENHFKKIPGFKNSGIFCGTLLSFISKDTY